MKLERKMCEIIGLDYVRDAINCHSPYGRTLLRDVFSGTVRYSPDELDAEFDRVDLAISLYSKSRSQMSRLERLFMHLKDIRRSIESCDDIVLDEVALFEIKRFVLELRDIAVSYGKLNEKFDDIEIDSCSEVLTLLNPEKEIGASFYISELYSDELKCIREFKKQVELQIRKAIGENDIVTLKIARSQLTNKEAAEETKVRRMLSRKVAQFKDKLLRIITSIGRLDLVMAKARLAIEFDSCRPLISKEPVYKIANMINPMIVSVLHECGFEFTPVSIEICAGATVITGANMGGKSVTLKTLALNAILAVHGFFVFAESAQLPVFENCLLICQDCENTRGGLSSFGGEIVTIKNALPLLHAGTLLLADEFARGTNPEEGAKIVKALVAYLNGKNALCVITTHYDGVAEIARNHYRVGGLQKFFENSGADNALSSDASNSIETIAKNMDYNLYIDNTASNCPKEARNICKFLLGDGELLHAILDEE